MSEVIMGWDCSDTIGILGHRAAKLVREGPMRLYGQVLKYGMIVELADIREDGTYTLETKKDSNSDWVTRYILRPRADSETRQ